MWRGEAVLRFSIDRHASRPVEVVSMDRSRADPNWEGWNMGRPIGQPATQDTTPAGEAVWFTDFTNFRWAIPQVCGFAGKAIYLDVDEVLLDDPAALFDLPIPRGYGALSLSPGETSVMLFDCGYFENLAGWPSVDEMKVNGWGIERYLNLA